MVPLAAHPPPHSPPQPPSGVRRGEQLFAALLGWVLGTALQLQQETLWSWQSYASACALAVLVLLGFLWWGFRLWCSRSYWLRASITFCCVVALGFAATGWRAVRFDQTHLNPDLEGRDVLVTGVVADMPQHNESGLRFVLDVDSATLNGADVVVPPHITVGWYSSGYAIGNEQVVQQRQPKEVYAGERWSMLLRLKAPHGSRNPMGLDYEQRLWEQGIQATAYVRAGTRDVVPQRLAQTWQHPIDLARHHLRSRILEAISPPQNAKLVTALVVGDQNAIERSDWDVFRATGVAHLVSISGLHITMFAWLAAHLVGMLWRRSGRLCLTLAAPSAALLGGVLLAMVYALFSGWGIPAQRTCLMLSCVAILRLLGLRWAWPQVWMLSCALVVGFDPWALLQSGFWLSFIAVGVLFASDAGVLHQAAAPTRTKRIGQRVLALLREQTVVSLALLPLSLLFFGQISVVGLLANLLAVPWVTLVVTPLCMLGVLWQPLWVLAGYAIDVLLLWLHTLASLPYANVSFATAPLGVGVLGVIGGLLLVGKLPWHLRGLGLPLLIAPLLWQTPLPPHGQFELLAADIGQGNAVLVRTAHHALLFDAGPRYSLESDAGHRVLVPLLQALGTRLDMVLLSHRDMDHVGGAAAVLAMQPQAQLLSSVDKDDPLQALRPAERCSAGQHWEWDGVQFSILRPLASDYDSPHPPNAMSCVLRIANAQQAALLVGDIEKAQEAQLVRDAAPVHADVLLVPHHGSKTSSSDEFLDAVQPRIALVQSGYRNRFGHPAPVVLQRYAIRQISVYDSPHCGAALWRSQQPHTVECTRELEKHYWSHPVPPLPTLAPQAVQSP